MSEDEFEEAYEQPNRSTSRAFRTLRRIPMAIPASAMTLIIGFGLGATWSGSKGVMPPLATNGAVTATNEAVATNKAAENRINDEALREIKLQVREHFNSRYPNMEVKQIDVASPSWKAKSDLQRFDRLTVTATVTYRFTLGRDQPLQQAAHRYTFEVRESGKFVFVGSNI